MMQDALSRWAPHFMKRKEPESDPDYEPDDQPPKKISRITVTTETCVDCLQKFKIEHREVVGL